MEIKEPDAEAEQNGNRRMREKNLPRQEFFYRVLIGAGVITTFGVLLILLWQSTEVILLIFAGLLLAIFLNGGAGWISRRATFKKLGIDRSFAGNNRDHRAGFLVVISFSARPILRNVKAFADDD